MNKNEEISERKVLHNLKGDPFDLFRHNLKAHYVLFVAIFCLLCSCSTRYYTDNMGNRVSDSFAEHYLACREYNKEKKYDQAIAECSKAIESEVSSEKTYAWIYLSRGIVYTNKRQYLFAIYDFNKAIQINQNPYAYAFRGYSYCALGQYERGISDIEIAKKETDNLGPGYSESDKKLMDIEIERFLEFCKCKCARTDSQ